MLAVEAAPREPRYMTALASFLADRGRPRDARVLLQQALALAPGDAATLAAHAMVCEVGPLAPAALAPAPPARRRAGGAGLRGAARQGKAVKDYDAAEESYLSAIRADGGNAELLYNAALFLKDKRKDLDRAEEYLQRAAEAAPLDRDINLAFGKFLIKHRKNRKLGAESAPAPPRPAPPRPTRTRSTPSAADSTGAGTSSWRRWRARGRRRAWRARRRRRRGHRAASTRRTRRAKRATGAKATRSWRQRAKRGASVRGWTRWWRRRGPTRRRGGAVAQSGGTERIARSCEASHDRVARTRRARRYVHVVFSPGKASPAAARKTTYPCLVDFCRLAAPGAI